MTKDELPALVDRSFGDLSRPGMFIRNKTEALDHNMVMEDFFRVKERLESTI